MWNQIHLYWLTGKEQRRQWRLIQPGTESVSEVLNYEEFLRKKKRLRKERQTGAYNIDHILYHNSRSLGFEVKTWHVVGQKSPMYTNKYMYLFCRFTTSSADYSQKLLTTVELFHKFLKEFQATQKQMIRKNSKDALERRMGKRTHTCRPSDKPWTGEKRNQSLRSASITN
jgi:hypothetical protein